MVGEIGRDKDRKGNAMMPEDRIGPFEIVAIAVVEGEADEAVAQMAPAQRAMRSSSRLTNSSPCRRSASIASSRNSGVTSSKQSG